MRSFNNMFAIAEKEIKLSLRFKVPFFTNHLVQPLIRITPFMLVYAGFFIGGANTIGGITESNFMIFLILGMLMDILFSVGYDSLQQSFMQEKYWQTIEAILVAPVSRFAFLAGHALNNLIGILPTIIMFFIVAFLIMPTAPQNIIVCIFLIPIILSISLGVGLIHASTALFNENYAPLFHYGRVALVFISCFYYPIAIFKETPILSFLEPLVLINPFYHALNAMRNVWMYGAIDWISIVYTILFALITPMIAVFFFNKMWKTLNIQGY